MLGNHNCFLLGDVAGCLLSALLGCKAAESTKINAVILGNRILDCVHKSYYYSLYTEFLKSRSFCYFIYNISFCHLLIYLCY